VRLRGYRLHLMGYAVETVEDTAQRGAEQIELLGGRHLLVGASMMVNMINKAV